MIPKAEVLKQIDVVLGKYQHFRSSSKYDDLSDHPKVTTTALRTLISDTIRRFAPPNSTYSESRGSILNYYGAESCSAIPHLAGVLDALRTAYASDYLAAAAELIRAGVFSDFLEMAEYLLSEGYKDPAAVIIGSVLEEHLRQLSQKCGIPTTVGGRTKKADQMNADLATNSAYSKLDQKSITAWLDLRNKAAHGKYSDYSKEQVTLLLQGVRDFMARVPA